MFQRLGAWLARRIGAVPPGEMKGLELEGPYCVVTCRDRDAARFLRALAAFVPAGSTLVLEGGAHPAELRGFLERSSCPPQVKLARGTKWPRETVFHLPATGATLEALAKRMEHLAQPELCSHLHVYDASGVLLTWWDAFFDPFHVSKRMPLEAIEALCATLRASWKDGAPTEG